MAFSQCWLGDIIKVKEFLGHQHLTTTRICDKQRRSLKGRPNRKFPFFLNPRSGSTCVQGLDRAAHGRSVAPDPDL